MFRKVKRLWRRKPLMIIMPLAIFARLLIAVTAYFSGTYTWEIENEIIGEFNSFETYRFFFSLNQLLSRIQDLFGDEGYSLFFPLEKVFYGTWSLITVYFGYKIAEKLSSRRSARLVGILLAAFYMLPQFVMSNGPTTLAVPFLILGLWFIISREDNPAIFFVYFISGLFFGFALITHEKLVFFIAGILLVSLLSGKLKESLGLITGMAIPVILVQGSISYFFSESPFFGMISSFHEFIRFSPQNSGSLFHFLLVLPLALIPPVALFLFFGFFRNWRKNLIVIVAILAHIAGNFIFTFNMWGSDMYMTVIFIIIFGIPGWNDYLDMSPFWQNRMNLMKYCWIFFWICNAFMFFYLTITYIILPAYAEVYI